MLKTRSPLVSIIMPAYNAESYILESVKSVINQTYKNWELIIVNDGSTDGTYDLVNRFQNNKIRVINLSHQGQGWATNCGIDIAQGDYFQFLDADDLLHPKKLENQLNDLLEFDNTTIGVSKWAFFHSNISEANFTDEPIYFSGKPNEWLYALWLNETMMSDHGYLIPRTVIESCGKYYDTSLDLNIDFEYFTRVILSSQWVVFSPNAYCYYRKQVKGSLTYHPNHKMKLNALRARVMAIKDLFSKDNSIQAKKAAQMALTVLTFSFPEIYRHAKKAIKSLELNSFADFGSSRFKRLRTLIGFEKTIQLKSLVYNLNLRTKV